MKVDKPKFAAVAGHIPCTDCPFTDDGGTLLSPFWDKSIALCETGRCPSNPEEYAAAVYHAETALADKEDRRAANLLAKSEAANAELRTLVELLADRCMMQVDGKYTGEYSTRINLALGR